MSTHRKFVWTSDEVSRENQTLSVLAAVETIFAVCLYWWIAYSFNTHIYLVTSLFVAPLLLLRSNQSIEKGLDWFTKDFFKLKNYENWPIKKRRMAFIALGFLTFLVVLYPASRATQMWMAEQTGVTLFFSSALLGIVVVTVALAIEFVVMSAVVGSVLVNSPISDAVMKPLVGWAIGAGAVVGVVVVAGGGAGAVVGAGVGVIAVPVGSAVATVIGGAVAVGGASAFSLVISLGLSLGLALRAIAVRILATTRHPVYGLQNLPSNWWNNNFVIDLGVMPELLPGIRRLDPIFSLDRLLVEMKKEDRVVFKFFIYPIFAFFFFVPAFLYRLNIKATCWFYWPLALLLKPIPFGNSKKEKERDLCYSVRNPIEAKIFSLIIFAWIIGSLWNIKGILDSITIPSVPVYLKYLLIVDWSSFRAWDWTNLVIASTSLGLLWIAGAAVANYKSGVDFSSESPKALHVVHILRRIRELAVIAALLLGLGSMAIHLAPELILEYLPAWHDPFQSFYQIKN